MIVKDGEIIAIDGVKVNAPLSGNGRPDSPIGLKTEINRPIYFSGTLGTNKTEQFFSIVGNTLSASPDVRFFNMSVNYNIATNNTCPDFTYSANLKFNNIDNLNYINGDIPNEKYEYSYNLYNNATDNKYVFNMIKDDKININNINVSCIGFIDNEIEPPQTVDILGDNSDFINFGDTLIRV